MSSHREILNIGFPGSTWGNLGLWAGAATYPQANEALATRLADLAGLQPGCRVLDAGFGYGDQLLLWKQRYGVGPITGIEIDAKGIESAQQKMASFADVAVGFDSGPWDECSHDHVLALDCAYHFATRRRFFTQAARALRVGGVLALTDLVVAARPGLRARLLARACGIPAENLLTEQDYARELRAAGFETVRLEPLDAVLEGFAAFATAHLRRHAVPLLSRGGLRIRLTALAVRLLGRRVRYVAVAARRASVSR
jgi:SAM-dependent methyltransferase